MVIPSLSIPSGMLQRLRKVLFKKFVEIFQFLLGCFLVNMDKDVIEVRDFQFLLGCFIEGTGGVIGGDVKLSIPSGMLPHSVIPSLSLFYYKNFQFLLGCFGGRHPPISQSVFYSLSIPSGMLLRYCPILRYGDTMHFQFLLGCFASASLLGHEEIQNFQFLLGCFGL